MTLPAFSFRRIGTSEVITGDNYLQWVLTFNGGELSTDLSSRSVYVLMQFEGDPAKRPLPAIGDPVDYARSHREEIVGELLGMVERWRERGCPQVEVACRFRPWAMLVNGLLRANGIEGFLSTYIGDSREGDERQAALEELAAARPNEYLRPAQWLAEAQRLHVFKEQLAGRQARSRQTNVGTILRACCGREILLEEEGVSPRRLRVERREDRNGSLYAFLAPVPEEQRGTTSAEAVRLQAHVESVGPTRLVKATIVP